MDECLEIVYQAGFLYKHKEIYGNEELEVLEKYGMEPDETPRRKKTKIYWLIVDDMIGSGIFSRSNKNKSAGS